MKRRQPNVTMTVNKTVHHDTAAIMRELRWWAVTIFTMVSLWTGAPYALDLIASKPAVAVAQNMVGAMKNPAP